MTNFVDSKQAFRKSHEDSFGAGQFLYNEFPQDGQKAFSQQSGPRRWSEDHAKLNWKPWYTNWSPAWRMNRHVGKPSKTKVTLILLWILLLWWGERRVFSNSISNCEWHKWEQWPSQVAPHHVVLLADPQIVDPHTYPGRPWPLSTLTIRHTDQYMRRSFSLIQQTLNPDSAFFLGDLFDGGREWGTGNSESPEKRWRKYGDKYWQKEYHRFKRIFFDNWNLSNNGKQKTGVNRKIIASLPGNHDLGIGSGIQLPVRDRFVTYFGDGNRVDIIGNHTFVSVDTVSLSAKGMPELAGAKATNEEIWRVPEKFLSEVKDRKARALSRELRASSGLPENVQHDHSVLELTDPLVQLQPERTTPNVSSEMPTILLTHVPLYRAPGTPCGPLRERHPPSKNPDGSPLEIDDANAISVSAGYQYQNVLQPDLSKELIEKIGSVEYVFSGDDHDYCEIVHRGFTSKGGGIREITVKSMSWAMGVRKPGFLLLSLWNPVDDRGDTSFPAYASGSTTLQSHLCLLPDQLSIFIRYGLLFALTMIVLVVRAFVIGFGRKSSSKASEEPLLPVSNPSSPYLISSESEKRQKPYPQSGSSSSNSSENAYPHGLAVRSNAGRARSLSPGNGYGIPIPAMSLSPGMNDSFGPASESRTFTFSDAQAAARVKESQYRNRKGMQAVWFELKRGISQVGFIALLWYCWLAYKS